MFVWRINLRRGRKDWVPIQKNLQDNLKNLVTENLHFAVDLISGEIISVPNENVDDVIYFLDELKSKGTPGLKDAIKLVVEAIREGYFLYGYNHEEWN